MSAASDPGAVPGAPPADAPGHPDAAAEPPLRVNPRGRWVTTPQGERIFLLDTPRPVAAQPAAAQPSAPTASASAAPPNPAGLVIPVSQLIPDDDDDRPALAAQTADSATASSARPPAPGAGEDGDLAPAGAQPAGAGQTGATDPEAGAEPPLRVNPRGRWVTTPQGERIFLLDTPRPAAAAPSAAQPSAATTDASANPAGLMIPVSQLIPDDDHPRPSPAARTAAATAPPERQPGPIVDDGGLPELQGEGLHEIIASEPALAVRWGAGVIATVVALLMLLAALVRYPEVVQGKATLTTPAPPVRVAAASGGEIQELLAADNQQAAAGQVVAVLRSSARWRDVRWVREQLERAGAGAVVARPARPLALGDVQAAWDEYLQAVSRYGDWASDPYAQARLDGMRRQVADQRRLGAESAARMRLLESEAALADRDAQRSRELVARQLLSPSEAERTEAAALAKRQALASARGEIVSQQLRAGELEGQILEMEQTRRNDSSRLQLDAEKARSALAEAVRLWETRYLLVAPIAGRVSYFRTLSPGQYLTPGDPVLAVVPPGGDAWGTVRVADDGAGRVRPGQRVLIAFPSFPVSDFGKVEARVRAVSLVPSQPAAGDQTGTPEYRVTLALPRGLRTSSGRVLPLRQEMEGDAEIVTDDLTVLSRLLAQFRGASAGAK